MNEAMKQKIENGEVFLGIELGSTRIKAVLIDNTYAPIASGGYNWENRLEDGYWTYHLDDVWTGVQTSFRELAKDVSERYGAALTKVASMGVSAMMHGYLAFDKEGNQLCPFRTWRNTTTEEAARLLSEKFNFNLPLRWSVAHLYQAMLNKEAHVKAVDFITTLSGYVHWKLTGKKVISVGDASGMFPIDSETKTYHAGMMEKFDALVAGDGYSWRLGEILPEVLVAGQQAGALTEEGARLLDPTGKLEAGVIMCPPEGDAGTGMVATNSVAAHTGNVSAGTSVFAMIVLDKELSKVYPEIDMVTTPAGKPATMVHCNNCTSDLDAWVSLFREVSELLGGDTKKPKVYDALYYKALEGDPDCGGLISYNYVSGEPITGFDKGCPMFVRTPDSRMTLANFFRAQLFSTMASLRIGMNILTEQEKVRLDVLMGHGGLFKTKGVGQRLMAGAMNIPVAVMETAGEGGAWGVALLASYLAEQKGESLEDYLNNKVFAGNSGERMAPDARDVEGFAGFMDRYQKGLAAQRGAVDNLL